MTKFFEWSKQKFISFHIIFKSASDGNPNGGFFINLEALFRLYGISIDLAVELQFSHCWLKASNVFVLSMRNTYMLNVCDYEIIWLALNRLYVYVYFIIIFFRIIFFRDVSWNFADFPFDLLSSFIILTFISVCYNSSIYIHIEFQYLRRTYLYSCVLLPIHFGKKKKK